MFLMMNIGISSTKGRETKEEGSISIAIYPTRGGRCTDFKCSTSDAPLLSMNNISDARKRMIVSSLS